LDKLRFCQTRICWIWSVSPPGLVPRLFGGGRKKSLVSTVCTCA